MSLIIAAFAMALMLWSFYDLIVTDRRERRGERERHERWLETPEGKAAQRTINLAIAAKLQEHIDEIKRRESYEAQERPAYPPLDTD